MFSKYAFFFVPFGIGDVQLKLLAKKATSAGGKIVDEVEAGQFRDGPLVVITSLDYDRLVDLLDDNEKVVLSYPKVQIHKPEWISTSVLRGKPCSESEFAVHASTVNFGGGTVSFEPAPAAKAPSPKIERRSSFGITGSQSATSNPTTGLKRSREDLPKPSIPEPAFKRPKLERVPSATKPPPVFSLFVDDEANEDEKDEKEQLRSSTGEIINFKEQLKQFDRKDSDSQPLKEEPEWFSGLLNPFSPQKKRPNESEERQELLEKAEKANAIKAEKRDGSSEHFSSLFSSSSSDSVNASANAGVGMTPYMMSLPEDQRKRNERLRARFSVQKSALTSLGNLNSHITDNLEVLEKNAAASKDQWRSLAYNKAIRALKNASFKVETKDDALRVPNIGKRILDKVVEILETGHLRRADLEKNDERNQVFDIFLKVWGAGPSTATKWYSQGFRTLDDLVNNPKAKLTYQQQVGIRYYDEFKQRIPRDEVTYIGKIVTDVAHLIDPQLKLVLGGSYRRGRATCGDVDILVTHKRSSCLPGVLAKIIDQLHLLDFLTDDLTTVRGEESDSYMGVCKIPNSDKPHRRIDIRVFPKECWGPALLYFTGSDIFNRSMRLWAQKIGYHLGNHELVKTIGGEQGERIPVKTEEDVFKILGLEYRKPEERDI